MRGWHALAEEVERLRGSQGACWIATSSYATTGRLAYEIKDKAPVVQLTERVRYAHLPPVDPSVLRCPALYVELERRSLPSLLQQRFGTVTFVKNVVRIDRGTALATYPVYLVANPIADVLFSPEGGGR